MYGDNENDNGLYRINIDHGANLASISFIAAGLAVFTILTGIIPIVLGSLAVILALLSRGNSPHVSGTAKKSIYIAVFAIIMGFAVSAYALWQIMSDPVTLDFMKKIYEAGRTMNYDEYMDLLRNYYNEQMIPGGKGSGSL